MKHGWKNNKKTVIVIACVLASAILAGYVFVKPKLINAPKPFIDLTASIGISIGSAKNAEAQHQPTPVITATPTPTPTVTPTPVITPVPDNKVKIRVEDTTVYINENSCVDSADFGNRLSLELKDESEITVVDDYAELKTYRNVIKVLKSMGISDYLTERID